LSAAFAKDSGLFWREAADRDIDEPIEEHAGVLETVFEETLREP
jgi:hypothetical protein